MEVQKNGPICCLLNDEKTERVWVGTDSRESPIILCSYDGKCTSVINGHTGKVNAMIEVDNKIWSASSDKTVRIWNANTGDCIKILYGHTGPVFTLTLTAQFVWSGSWDKNIILWDSKVRFLHFNLLFVSLLIIFNFITCVVSNNGERI